MEYWSKIHSFINDITNDTFEFSPRLYVLGDPAVLDNCQNAQFIQTALMIGRQILLREWKNSKSPPIKDWFCEIGRVASYEQLFFRINDRWDEYKTKWQKYLSYIEKEK